MSDSVFSKVGFSAFIEKQLQILNISDKNRLLSDLKAFKTLKKPILPPLHGSVAIESFWNTGDTLLYGNAANQAFSSVAPELSFSVAGMPMIGGANLVFQNNSFRPDLSTYSLQFDYARFLDNKRAQLQEQALAKKRSIWSKSDVTNFTNQAKWETLQNVVYHPDFQQNKQNLILIRDSLKQLNPILTEKLRNKIDNIEDEISQYNTAEKELSNLLEHYKKNPDAFAKGDILRGEVDQLKTQLEGELYGQKAQGEAITFQS